MTPLAASISRSASPADSVRGSVRVAARQLELGGRVVAARADQLEVAEERARRRGAARDRRGREPVGAELRDVALEVVEPSRPATRRAEERAQRGEVAPVRVDCPRRAPRREQREERLDVAVRIGVGAVVDTAEALRVDVAVDLRRREGRVAEQLLDHAQVGAALEQVRRERVAQPMRVGGQAAKRRGVEPPAAGREEERVLGAARELRPRLAQVARDPVRRLLAERHDAVLRPLPLRTCTCSCSKSTSARSSPTASALRSPAE